MAAEPTEALVPTQAIKQSSIKRFTSEDLVEPSRDGGTGRRSGLKIRRASALGGSTPPPGTTICYLLSITYKIVIACVLGLSYRFPMLTIYRRHRATCKHRSRQFKGCFCPIWVQGVLDGKPVRRSLDLTGWEAAQRKVRELEIEGEGKVLSVSEASERFLEDCKARNMSEGMQRKYKNVCAELEDAFPSLRSVTIDDVRKLRENWELAAITKQKRLEMLRRFFGFCVDSGWMKTNPARGVKSSLAEYDPTMPYSKDEIERMLRAADTVREIHPKMPQGIEKKLRAIILLMLHSGVRISDAVLLHRDRIKKGKLFLRQAKTKHPMWVPLPKKVLEALNECGEGNSHYFYNGIGKSKTAITEWQARLRNVYTIAGITEDGYKSHRLRDTFATSLLEKGVSLETVSMLLGHQSIAVTQRHYSPWIKSRQTALEAAVKSTWS